MLVLFDPTLEGFSPEPISIEDDQLVPIYKQAKMYSALLPGQSDSVKSWSEKDYLKLLITITKKLGSAQFFFWNSI